MGEPLVSVVMLSFNNIDIIGTCLEYLSKSTYRNMETVILDCGSRDNSPNYISENFPWVRLIRFQKDPGADAAYTYGVRQAKGSYILLLSADVRVFPNTITNLVRSMETESLDVAVPVCLDWEGRYVNAGIAGEFFNVRGYDLFGFFLHKIFSSIRSERPFYFIFACCLVRRDVYLETPFNQHIGFYEDVEWAWRLDLKGKKVKVLEDVYCMHKSGSSVKGRRAIFYEARFVFATLVICAKTDVLLFISMPEATTQLTRLFVEIANGRLGNAQSMVNGWADLLRLTPEYLNDRKILSSQIGKSSYNFLSRFVEAENYKRKRKPLVGKLIIHVQEENKF